MSESIRIESERLLIRELEVDDISASYLAWLEDPEVNQFLETRFDKQTYESISEFVQEHKQRTDSYLLGIFSKNDMRHIGNIKLGPINSHHASSQISFLIGARDTWGCGYATEAVALVTSWGFKKLRLARIEAGCYERNFGSLKVLLSCGYEVEGFFRKSRIAADGSRTGSFWLGKLAP